MCTPLLLMDPQFVRSGPHNLFSHDIPEYSGIGSWRNNLFSLDIPEYSGIGKFLEEINYSFGGMGGRLSVIHGARLVPKKMVFFDPTDRTILKKFKFANGADVINELDPTRSGLYNSSIDVGVIIQARQTCIMSFHGTHE